MLSAAIVDLSNGRILTMSAWLIARDVSSCVAGTTPLWYTGQDTSSWPNLTMPPDQPRWIAMSFGLADLRPRTTDPIPDVDFVNSLAAGNDDLVVHGYSSESVDWPVAERTYWFARYGTDGKRL